MADKILDQLQRELIIRKIDTEKSKRNAFMAMEFFFIKEVEVERETLELKRKRKK